MEHSKKICTKCQESVDHDAKFCTKCGGVIGNGAHYDLKPAQSYQRFFNLILDYVGIYALAFTIGFAAAIIGLGEEIQNIPSVVLGIIIVITYYVFFEFLFQRTPGKWITGTKVVSADGHKPTFAQIFGRTLTRIIPFEAFTFLGAWTVGLHDSAANTFVVPKRYTTEDVVEMARCYKNRKR